MQNPVVTRAEWLAARAELLRAEKALTRQRAELAARRRALPWVRIDTDYTLVGTEGPVTLAQMFRECSQLVVYHLMFGPGWTRPCTGCTQWANALERTTDSFGAADARLVVVSGAPPAEIAAQRAAFNWTFDWYSSADSDFNRDFHGSSPDRSATSTRQVGAEVVTFDRGENHGVSVFFRNAAGEVFHTYSAYNRGIEELNGALGYYDLLPKGRAW